METKMLDLGFAMARLKIGKATMSLEILSPGSTGEGNHFYVPPQNITISEKENLIKLRDALIEALK